MSSPELPEHPREGRLVSPQAADAALVRKPQIGDTRPAPIVAPSQPSDGENSSDSPANRGGGDSKRSEKSNRGEKSGRAGRNRRGGKNRRRRGDRTGDRDSTRSSRSAVVETDAELIERRRGKERNGRPLGRYMMCVQVRKDFTQVAML